MKKEFKVTLDPADEDYFYDKKTFNAHVNGDKLALTLIELCDKVIAPLWKEVESESQAEKILERTYDIIRDNLGDLDEYQ